MNVYMFTVRELNFTKDASTCVYLFQYVLHDGVHGTYMHIALAELLWKRLSLVV